MNQFSTHKQFPIHILNFNEPFGARFPQLWNVDPPPSTLYIQGEEKSLELLLRLPSEGLAIVGSRNPEPRSTHLLKKWILEMRGAPLVILSGFARGIDGAAHQAALEAKIPTIAILGAGLDINYPYEHSTLRTQILASGGLMVSEFPPHTSAWAGNFIKRNRLIAAWSSAVLIVEAALRSGALNTAKWARDHDRTCYVVPCFPGDPRRAGNQILLDQESATPFWGPQSLGSTWISLANHVFRKKNKPENSLSFSSDELQLARYIEWVTAQQGGAQIPELLNWAMALHWTPQRFYGALQSGLEANLFLDKNGLVLKNS